ncbi:SNF2 family N-terminal domain-containing protein [Apiosordaria backusii]|uniref:SNF2 family N-terminal domain-containing protein n=1 Tax=Apiosordaria backusii TaxID=314023 RepID=A0AA40E675_9PEZI|nr:SNF2 family N-terminal domain-containing protein [Apiosordaria backusii]
MRTLPNRERKRGADHAIDAPFPKRPLLFGQDATTTHVLEPMDMDVDKVFSAKAQVSFIEKLVIPIDPWSLFSSFPVVRRNNKKAESFQITQSPDHETGDFALVDLITTRHLEALLHLENIIFTAVMSATSFAKIPRKATRKKTIIDVTVNISGPEHLADAVGAALAHLNCHLQHPVYLDSALGYKNPHYFYPGGIRTDLRHLIGPEPEAAEITSAQVSQHIDALLGSLDEHSTEGSNEIECNITAIVQLHLANTKLQKYQISGIRFILAREDLNHCHIADHELWGLLDYKIVSKLSSPCRGGILADVMGLGKTLTMLSAIVCTKEDAATFAQSEGDDIGSCSRPKAGTLVVLPSIQLLDVWSSEIHRHFHPGTLSNYVFHGADRPKSANLLLRHDIVLTTYGTLAADWERSRVLQEIHWFRVVLDEAHCIRNQATAMFKAAHCLEAERRWCLTGTPIQNSLMDLRSLLKFLRHEPLSETSIFNKHIIDPIRSDPTANESFRNLQLLLRTICLRRTESLLNLPPSTTEMMPISLSPEEISAYEGILSDCQAEFERQVCGKSDLKSFNILFQTVQKLRMLCNHGTFATDNQEQRSRKRSKSREPGFSGSDLCILCSDMDEDSRASLNGATECPLCGHLFAPSRSQPSTPLNTSFLGIPGPSSRTPTPSLEYYSPPAGLSPVNSPAGHSSKLSAVVQNIQKSFTVDGSKR